MLFVLRSSFYVREYLQLATCSDRFNDTNELSCETDSNKIYEFKNHICLYKLLTGSFSHLLECVYLSLFPFFAVICRFWSSVVAICQESIVSIDNSRSVCSCIDETLFCYCEPMATEFYYIYMVFNKR